MSKFLDSIIGHAIGDAGVNCFLYSYKDSYKEN